MVRKGKLMIHCVMPAKNTYSQIGGIAPIVVILEGKGEFIEG